MSLATCKIQRYHTWNVGEEDEAGAITPLDAESRLADQVQQAICGETPP